MGYYFSKTIEASFDNAVQRVTVALMSEGFGVLTEIDIKATLKKKLNVDLPVAVGAIDHSAEPVGAVGGGV